MKLKLIVFLFVFQTLPVSALSVEESERQLAILDPSVYGREIMYEALDLPVEDRARREADLMLETVKTQVESVYRNLLSQTGNVELAISGVREKIIDDTRKMSPNLRTEIRDVALAFLDSVARGEMTSAATSAPILEMEMAKTSQAHSSLLRSGFILLNENPQTSSTKMLRAETVRTSDTMEYKNKAELIASLISLEQSSIGGSLGSGAWINSAKSTTVGGSVSYRVSVNFLGANLNAGPSLSFNRTFNTSVSVSGDGLAPLTLINDFDFYVRDENGRVKMKNGKPERRYLTFVCNADLNFSTSVLGSGRISVMGVGSDVSASKTYSNSVGLNSRRVAVPEYIEGKTVNMAVLAQICHRDFLNAKLRNNLTLKDSLNIMMRDVISTLVYSNPKTKCVTDSHCANWFNKNVRPVSGNTAVGRCLEESREHYFACYARGVVGTKCPISAGGKLISDGKNEYHCDRGLRCVQVKEYGWLKGLSIFQYAEGRCRK